MVERAAMHRLSATEHNKVRSIHAGFEPKMAQKAHGYCVAALCSALFLATAAFGPAHALTTEELQPTVREALKSHPFTKPGAAIPAFSWVLEKTRTLRKPHIVTESFAAAPQGVAAVKVTDQRSGEDASAPRTRMSLRGLEYIDADDAELAVLAQGLDMPPKTGGSFTITLKKDGQALIKTCKVGERTAASALFANLPGEMAPIECAGDGTYRGSKVKTKTQMAWLDALGVFLLRREEADTALGKFTETVTVKQFSK
jgi:hypothetical protein